MLIDPIGNNEGINNTEKWPVAWQLMHQVNDDFGGIALAGSYELFKRDIYLSRMSAYFKWLQGTSNSDGSYLDPVMEVASATVPIFLNSYKKLAPENEQGAVSETAAKALDFLLTLQQHCDDKDVNGAFLGMNNKCRDGLGKWVNIRCTAYAIIALLQASDDAAFPA